MLVAAMAMAMAMACVVQGQPPKIEADGQDIRLSAGPTGDVTFQAGCQEVRLSFILISPLGKDRVPMVVSDHHARATSLFFLHVSLLLAPPTALGLAASRSCGTGLVLRHDRR